MCSYSKCNEWKVDEPDGLINLYSMALRKRPEHTLVSQYEVTKAIFNPFQPNIVIGATYSGYILQWDIRAKNIPIQKSCLAKNGHNHPVYSLAIVGSQNAHNIVSVSNDGKCCFWSFGMLNEPKINFNLNQMPGKDGQVQTSSG
jgi:dynein intermediate chain